VADPALHVEYVPLEALRPDPRNPKGHDLDLLEESMERHGYVELVMVDERTGLLLSGHGRRERLAEAFAAGDPPPDGVRVGDGGRWLVPTVRGYRSRDDDDALAMLVGLNHIGELGGWVNVMLSDALGTLTDLSRDLTAAGFTDDERIDLAALLAQDGVGEAGPAARDDADWPVLRFKVPPGVRDRFERLVEPGDDVARLQRLVELAESA
jgi:hypothetical protein